MRLRTRGDVDGRDPGVALLAGGTDLLVQRRAGTRRGPIADISGLSDAPPPVQVLDGLIRLSAVAPLSVLEDHLAVLDGSAALMAGLRAAMRVFASGQIRNRATLGGNLANASPAADCVPPLVAASAMLRLRGPDGSRVVPVDRFATAPGRTVLKPAEWIETVDIPTLTIEPTDTLSTASPPPSPSETPGRSGGGDEVCGGLRVVSGFRKVAGRRALAISVVSLAWQWTADSDGTLSDVRLAAGAVAPTVIRCRNAERALEGRVPTPDLAEAIQEDIAPIDDLRASAAYRRAALAGALCEALMRRNP
ncbi:FAD binding domain-containing protein [Nonomuraea sp. NPDC050536]|uniref:FAD binding domain-containing protein n=1 Tax=Nonomuraea sp. NPDC050536 TaxID=3364366 RepID=UPI0037CA1170